MSAKPLLLSSAVMLLLTAQVAAQQQPGSDFPDGPGKQQVVDACHGCHDINRLKVGYTPEGWLTVVRMMQNFDTPVSAQDWPVVMGYLIKNFPERQRPTAAIVQGPAQANIKMFDVPTQGS